MASLITGLIFIGIIVSMLLLLAGFQAIATFNARKRVQRTRIGIPITNPSGAKVIPLPRNVLKPSKEKVIVNETMSEEII